MDPIILLIVVVLNSIGPMIVWYGNIDKKNKRQYLEKLKTNGCPKCGNKTFKKEDYLDSEEVVIDDYHTSRYDYFPRIIIQCSKCNNVLYSHGLESSYNGEVVNHYDAVKFIQKEWEEEFNWVNFGGFVTGIILGLTIFIFTFPSVMLK